MTDGVGRRGRRDEDDDFGPPLFSDEPMGSEATIRLDPSDSFSFGNSDTGPLPHWTEPPTGEVPAVLSTQRHDVTPADPSDDLDVWSSFSDRAPVWSDDLPPTGEVRLGATGEQPRQPAVVDVFDEADPSVPVRRGPGRITIGTDPTDERAGRPMPKGRSRSGRVDPSRGTTRPAPATSRTAPPPPAGRDMPLAVAFGLVLAAVFIAALLWKPWAVLAVIVAVVLLAAVEFYDKVAEKGYRPATVAGIAASVGLPLAAYWVGEAAIPLVLFLALAATVLTFVTSTSIESSPLPNTAITLLGVVWIGVLGAFAALILGWSNVAGQPHVGTDTLFLLALGVVANDVGALFVGSAAGRHPLREWISPQKTIEGFVGGAIMTILAMIVVGASGTSDTWTSTSDLIILGIVISLAAPLGDLTESMFKRNLEIKDFGNIIRGHGGVLDRFDGFLFTLPAVYYLTLVITPWIP